jgi:hypothetical protein
MAWQLSYCNPLKSFCSPTCCLSTFGLLLDMPAWVEEEILARGSYILSRTKPVLFGDHLELLWCETKITQQHHFPISVIKRINKKGDMWGAIRKMVPMVPMVPMMSRMRQKISVIIPTIMTNDRRGHSVVTVFRCTSVEIGMYLKD